MKLSWVYAALAVFMVTVGMFLSNASVEANIGVALAIAVLICLSVVYWLQERKEPARPVLRAAGIAAGSPADPQIAQRLIDLSAQMRAEPDPVRYAALKRRRDQVASLAWVD